MKKERKKVPQKFFSLTGKNLFFPFLKIKELNFERYDSFLLTK